MLKPHVVRAFFVTPFLVPAAALLWVAVWIAPAEVCSFFREGARLWQDWDGEG